MRWFRPALRVFLVVAVLRIGFLLFAYFLGRAGVERHHLESTFFVFGGLALVYLGTLDAGSESTAKNGMRWSLLVGAAAAGALMLFWRALTVGWLSDDWVLADWARRSEFIGQHREFVRPLPLVLWRMLFALGGGPVATHVANVVLHVLNATLTALLARELGAPRTTAWFTGAIFLAWPTQVETVVWASAVFDAIVTSCVLALALLYTRFVPRFTPARVALLFAIAAAAVLTKESAVAIPGLLLVVALPRWIRRRPGRSEVMTFVLLCASCAAYLAWRVLLRPAVAGTPLPAVTRYTVKEFVSRTFAALAVPFGRDLIANHPTLVTIFALSFVLLGVAALVIARERQASHVLAVQGLSWSLLATGPALGYLFIGPYLQGSRYVYTAAAGWAWFVAAVTLTRETRRLAWARAAILIALLAVSVAQDTVLVNDWRTSALIRDALLVQARQIAVQERCGGMRLASVPPPYKGTQLFLNGFEQAFQSVTGTATSGSSCVVRWDGRTLHRE